MPRAALSFALVAAMAGLTPVVASLIGVSVADRALAAGVLADAPDGIAVVVRQTMPDAAPAPPTVVKKKPAKTVKSPKPGNSNAVVGTKPSRPAPAVPKQPANSAPEADAALRSSVSPDPVITGAATARKPYTPPIPGDVMVPVTPSLDVTAPAPSGEDDDQLVPNTTAPDPTLGPKPGMVQDGLEAPDRPSSVPRLGTTPPAPGTAQTSPPALPASATDPQGVISASTPARKTKPKSPGPVQPAQLPAEAGQTKLAVVPPALATTPNPRSTAEDPYAEPSVSPYDPQGIRTGSFIWRPAIEISAGRTTNVQSTHDGIASSALRLAPELIGQSDWSRHALGIELRGSYTDFPADQSLYRPTFNAIATGRIDVTDETRINLKAAYALDKLPAASTQSAAGTSTAGYQRTISASAGLTQEFGRFAVTLRGDLDRTLYEVGSTGATATTAAAPLDNSRYVAALRGTFTWTEAVKPFLEGDLTLRRYDDVVVATGLAPPTDLSSSGMIGKAGVALDFGPMLTGETAIGYGREKPFDASLSAVTGMTFDGSLVWSPTRLTKVTFNAATAFEATMLTGASGAVSHTFGIKVADDIRRNLTAEVGSSILLRDYTGVSRRETITSLNGALIWKWNPHLQTFLKGTFDDYASTEGSDDYRAATVYAGLRLQ